MITVLTPTFNRAHTLERLFNSLAVQTGAGFEWLVVDDGSTDDTQAVLERLGPQAGFDMRVIRQNNGGKHVAVNTGCAAARGEWVFIVDSDDMLTPDAIEAVHAQIRANTEPDVVGLCFRKAHETGELIGQVTAYEAPVYLHPTEAGKIFKGDLAYIFLRSSLLAHPFPVIPDEKFVPELYIWNKIGDEGKILFVQDKVIYLCEYLPDGYTANFSGYLKRNPRGFLLFYWSQALRERTMFYKTKYMIRTVQCLLYACLKRARS
jgi:glycosyltransferase involved in cell wall biosynthesis